MSSTRMSHGRCRGLGLHQILGMRPDTGSYAPYIVLYASQSTGYGVNEKVIEQDDSSD